MAFVLLGLLLLAGFFWPNQLTAQVESRPLQLKFIGNKHVRSAVLKKQWPAQSAGSDSAKLSEFSQKVAKIYRKNGYYFARVESFQWENSEGARRLTLRISEGKRLRVKKIRVEGSRIFSEKDILNRFRTKRGRAFRTDELESDIRELLKRYAQKGHPLARVKIARFRLDSTRSHLWLGLKIDEGPVGRLDSLIVLGNKITRRQTILRELGLQAGALFSQKKLEEIPIHLRRLPFLHLREPVTVAWDSSGRGVVVIPVREENMAHFDGMVGFNPPRGKSKGSFTGLIDVSFQNLFGTGRAFSAFWQKKEAQSQEIRLFYREPWILNRPVNATLNFEQRLQDSTYIRRAWSAGVEFRWLENFQMLMQVGQEAILPDSLGALLLGIQRSRALRLSAGVKFDNRDDWLNPRAGLFYHTSVDFLRRRAGGTQQSVRRTSLDFEGYWNWFGRQVWALKLHGRDVRFPGGAVPVAEQFFLGGSRTLRGYREDQFRGSRVAWASLEYRYLLGPQSRVFLFLDSGWISSRKKAANTESNLLRLGFGLGVRLQTALGVVGLDYGLGEGDALSQGKIHLRLINQF